jgi:hypothetical protein
MTEELMPTPIHGSCFCKQVKFVITGPLTQVCNCHCSMCRKQHAAAFRSRATVQAADFRWLAGEDKLTHYEYLPGSFTAFCGTCGSRMLSYGPATPDSYGIALGVLDDDPGVRPRAHIMVAYKAPWHEIAGELPQFPEFPPAPAQAARKT